MQTTNTCPQCGAPLELNINVCNYCDSRLQQPVQHLPVQPIQRVQPMPQPVPLYNPQFNQMGSPYNPMWPVKSKITAGLLAIFLGGLGIHKFYLGKIGMGILYLIFCWTYIPAFIGFIEGIVYICSNDHNFQVKHQVRLR